MTALRSPFPAGSRRGLTLVELFVMSAVAMFVLAFIWRIQQRQVQVSVGDQKTAAYFYDVTRFLEAFQNDAAMAFTITRVPDGCRMEVRREGGNQLISYVRLGDTVVREVAGKKRVFSFKPLESRDPASFVFSLEEVVP